VSDPASGLPEFAFDEASYHSNMSTTRAKA